MEISYLLVQQYRHICYIELIVCTKYVARGSVDISAKNKQAISIEFHNPVDSQTTAKLLMKLLSEEIARQIYNKKNNYENLDTSDKKQEGRNLS